MKHFELKFGRKSFRGAHQNLELKTIIVVQKWWRGYIKKEVSKDTKWKFFLSPASLSIFIKIFYLFFSKLVLLLADSSTPTLILVMSFPTFQATFDHYFNHKFNQGGIFFLAFCEPWLRHQYFL